jgi:hypothetical protein
MRHTLISRALFCTDVVGFAFPLAAQSAEPATGPCEQIKVNSSLQFSSRATTNKASSFAAAQLSLPKTDVLRFDAVLAAQLCLPNPACLLIAHALPPSSANIHGALRQQFLPCPCRATSNSLNRVALNQFRARSPGR